MKKTIYLVQMAKGTDNAYDETAALRTLLKTTNKKEALAFFDTLPACRPLEEPEHDLEGSEKYESPIVVAVHPDGTKRVIKEA